jgi:hypothetical protein
LSAPRGYLRASALALALALCPRAALGDAQLELGVETSLEYDDNVVFLEDKEGDGLWRIGPTLRAYDTRGDLNWELRYRPDYEKFFDLSELDGWNHDAYGSVAWQLSTRTRVSLYDHFIDTNRSVRALEEADPLSPAGEAAALFDQRGFRQNVVSGEISHLLTPIDSFVFSAQNVLSQTDPFESSSETEGNVTSVDLSYLRSLSRRNQAGLVLRYTSQVFDNVTFDQQTRSDYYSLLLQWVHQLDPTWTFSVAAGPAWVSRENPDQEIGLNDRSLYPVLRGPTGSGPVRIDTCPSSGGSFVLSAECEVVPASSFVSTNVFGPNPGLVFQEDLALLTDLSLIGAAPDRTSEGWTYFADVALSKQWETWTATLRYNRDATSSVSTSGSLRDVVTGRLEWRPGERWSANFSASWERREEAVSALGFEQFLVPAQGFVLGPTGLSTVPIGQAAGVRVFEVNDTRTSDRWILQLSAQYRASRRTTIFSRITWIDIEEEAVGGLDSTSRFLFQVGVRYVFDPIPLPI